MANRITIRDNRVLSLESDEPLTNDEYESLILRAQEKLDQGEPLVVHGIELVWLPNV